MKRIKYSILITLILIFSQTIFVYAEDRNVEVPITYTKNAFYEITVPKLIKIDTSNEFTTFDIKVKGNIEESKSIKVEVKNPSLILKDSSGALKVKDDIIATVNFVNNIWNQDAAINEEIHSGIINYTDIPAGYWKGNLIFNITMENN